MIVIVQYSRIATILKLLFLGCKKHHEREGKHFIRLVLFFILFSILSFFFVCLFV